MAQNIHALHYCIREPSTKKPRSCVWVLHEAKKKGELFWSINYKKGNPKAADKSPDVLVTDPMVVLGAMMCNYQLRFSDIQLGGQANLFRPDSLVSVVFDGVDIKAVFGQERFKLPEEPLSLEALREIGNAAKNDIDAWLKKGGIRMGTASEAFSRVG